MTTVKLATIPTEAMMHWSSIMTSNFIFCVDKLLFSSETEVFISACLVASCTGYASFTVSKQENGV